MFRSPYLTVAVVMLVGNKTDLAEDRVVSEEEGQEYAERYKYPVGHVLPG